MGRKSKVMCTVYAHWRRQSTSIDVKFKQRDERRAEKTACPTLLKTNPLLLLDLSFIARCNFSRSHQEKRGSFPVCDSLTSFIIYQNVNKVAFAVEWEKKRENSRLHLSN